jgi:hypothetical protein
MNFARLLDLTRMRCSLRSAENRAPQTGIEMHVHHQIVFAPQQLAIEKDRGDRESAGAELRCCEAEHASTCLHHQESWMKSLNLGAVLSLTLLGCADQAAQPSFEELRAETLRSFEGESYHLVSGDLAVSEAELRTMYDRMYSEGFSSTEQHSIVNRVSNRDDKWSATQALNLTYCVSDEFGTLKARMISEMNQATAEWEAVARVNFTYVAAQDARCRGSNRSIAFAVRPWTSGGACAFFPSGGGCVRRSLVIDVVDLDTNFGDISPNVRTVGVLRHELGHILGLRHEHTRPESGTCFEDTSWRALTAYDRNSVMHYPWCNGNTQSSLAITNSDAAGASALYGTP